MRKILLQIAATCMVLVPVGIVMIKLGVETRATSSQVNSELIKLESSQRREMHPDEESWLVIDQIYQVWLNHGEFSETDQLKKVILTLTSQGYKVNSMTVTSYVARARRIDGTPMFLNDQTPNTVTLFVSK